MGMKMNSVPAKILLLLAFMILFAACGEVTDLKGPFEVTVQMDFPAPLSNQEVGIQVTPDSTMRVAGRVVLDLESISDNMDDVTNIVIAIIPAVVSFDSTGTFLSSPASTDLLSAQADSAITISIYFAPTGTEDPFREDFQAARFFIDIEDSEVAGVSGAADVPSPLIETIMSGEMQVGIKLDSFVAGRLSIQTAELTFYLKRL